MYQQAGMIVRKVRFGDIVANIYLEDINLPWLIVLPGIPYYFHKQAYFKKLVSKYTVLAPHYPGSYHSYGTFKLNALKNVIKECLDFISINEFYDYFESKPYKHKGEISGMIGLSFGANLLLDYLVNENSLKNLKYCLISPIFDMNNDEVNSYWEKKLSFLLTEVNSQVYRGMDKSELKNFFQELMMKKQNYRNFDDLFIVRGTDDKYVTEGFIDSYFPSSKFKSFSKVSHEVDKLLELSLESELIF